MKLKLPEAFVERWHAGARTLSKAPSRSRLLVRPATVKKMPSKRRKKKLRKIAQASRRKNRR